MRDSGIPRRKFLNTIIEIAQKYNIPYQLEVEDSGGSDGNVLNRSSLPFQWCFIGAAEDNVHSPFEKVAIQDFKAMLNLYKKLLNDQVNATLDIERNTPHVWHLLYGYFPEAKASLSKISKFLQEILKTSNI